MTAEWGIQPVRGSAYLATENPKSSGMSIAMTTSINVITTSVDPVTWS